jgi:fructose-1,6-bisphosphatase-3
VQAASTEIINLQAILNLPKGTEHFMSDLHGEYEAFLHILNNCSGAVREKVDILFENSVSKEERARLATLIYYPEEKLEEIHETIQDLNECTRSR